MKETNNNAKSGGIGFWGLLQILLIGLKLTGYIDWSWWWVFAPVIAGVSLTAVILVVVGGIFLAVAIMDR